MSMSMRLTAPFIETDNLLTRPFFQRMEATDKPVAFRSRVVPRLDRRQIGVGLLRNINPVQFDVDNPLHMQAWATFYTSGKWTMHFILEQPWDMVPQMIQDKVLAKLANQIGPAPVQPAPVRLVNDSIVPNTPSQDESQTHLNSNHPEVGHVKMRTPSGDTYYAVVQPTE